MRTLVSFFRQDNFPLQIWGPIFLLCTLAASRETAIPFDTLFIALVGLYLSAKWQIRGCTYAFILLGLGSILKHCLIDNHLWQLGLEGSLACAFFITALAFEQGEAIIQSLTSQRDSGQSALQNLEEELNKFRESSLAQQVALQEKIDALTKDLEELQNDHSSLFILNEVLRKTTARKTQEQQEISQKMLGSEMRIELLEKELEELRQGNRRMREESPLLIENGELLQECNAIRYEKEQTHLINETLVRLHAKESLRADEAEEKIALLQQKVYAPHPHQTLHRELKKQFEERNKVLHQTRSEFFKAETELEALKIEHASCQLNPFPQELQKELDIASEEIARLEEENRHLEELTTTLTKATAPKKRKKSQESTPDFSL